MCTYVFIEQLETEKSCMKFQISKIWQDFIICGQICLNPTHTHTVALSINSFKSKLIKHYYTSLMWQNYFHKPLIN